MTTRAAARVSSAEPVEQRLIGLADLTREMFAQVGLDDTVRAVMELALQTFGCDAVGILLGVDGGGVAAAAATDRDAGRADAMQVASHEGPGLQAIARSQPVIVDELRFDSRWRFWSPQVADLGFRSVLSVDLTDGDITGALNLYSRCTSFFGADVLDLCQAFAQHASMAVAIARERAQLLRAVDSRGLIGQAQGILMERYNITADQAFTVLRRYSSHLNKKLRLIAEGVIRDRGLPELDAVDDEPGMATVPDGNAWHLDLYAGTLLDPTGT